MTGGQRLEIGLESKGWRYDYRKEAVDRTGGKRQGIGLEDRFWERPGEQRLEIGLEERDCSVTMKE